MIVLTNGKTYKGEIVQFEWTCGRDDVAHTHSLTLCANSRTFGRERVHFASDRRALVSGIPQHYKFIGKSVEIIQFLPNIQSSHNPTLL